MAKPRKVAINPLMLLTGKQAVGKADADAIAVPVLLSLDACKRGIAPNSLANTLSAHIVMATVIFSKAGNRPLYDAAEKAWRAMEKACSRPTDLITFTTGEYQAIRTAIAYYLRALPTIQLCVLAYAKQRADELMGQS